MATNEDISQYLQSHFVMSTKQILYMNCIINLQANENNIQANEISDESKYMYDYYTKFKTAPFDKCYREQQFPIKKYKQTLHLLANYLQNPSDIQAILQENRKNEEEKECHECIQSVTRNNFSTRQWIRKYNRRCTTCVEHL